MEYRRRLVDGLLDEVVPELAAVALEGAKGVGKTATAAQRARTRFDLADPVQRMLLEGHLDRVTRAETPVLLDEWQLLPAVWDRVRRAVDDDRTGGRFLLTGSAHVPPGVQIHSGAGRIVSIRMRPLSFAERGPTSPTVSLATLFSGRRAPVEGESTIDLTGYVDEIVRSGFPGIRDLGRRGRQIQLDSYLDRIVTKELPLNGATVRHPAALRAWLAAYGAAIATNASYTSILDAATPGEGYKPTRQTVTVYREHLERLFILDPLEAWIPTFSPLTRLTVTPKHHLVDPALAARMAGVGVDDLLRGEPARPGPDTSAWIGALFESLVAQSVRVYAEAVDARVGHLRTKEGTREIDLVIEGPGRRIVAVEVKLSPLVEDRDVRHLLWLRSTLGDRVADLVVVTTGPYAYRRPDGVAVVPLALLGP